MLDRPLGIYLNWSAYDELSDAVPLDQDLAMHQFDHLLRLRRAGVRIDAYVMDCFWYDPDGAYRTWRRPHWRDDGETWLKACRDHGVLPGLWFGCNRVGSQWIGLHRHPRWTGSIDPTLDAAAKGNCCLFEGPFLADLMEVFDHWYQRGIRIFKLDFLDQSARLAHHRLALLRRDVEARNAGALRGALAAFRAGHPEALIIGYNGFEDEQAQTGTGNAPFRSMDMRWLEALDGFYTGDPRPADVPTLPFWRSKDIYSDHLVRHYLAQGFDRRVLDSASFMMGTTGTCYHRGAEAWKGMLALNLARGSWLNTWYGNLELLSDADAAWFARAQDLFWGLIGHGRQRLLGGLPGAGAIYGFHLADDVGALSAVVNPGMVHQQLELPGPGRVLFCDAGDPPRMEGQRLRLGPGQMALIGHGARADARFDLGLEPDVVIPAIAQALPCTTTSEPDGTATATVRVPAGHRLRLILRQQNPDGTPRRTTGGAPPSGTPLHYLLRLGARQGNRELPAAQDYGKMIWSGLSWAAVEIAAADLDPAEPVLVRASTSEPVGAVLTLEAYAVA